MDDSDQDFADLCSKLLKRVRKKPCETKQPRKAERQLSSQSSEGDKRRVNNKKDGESGSKVTRTQSVCTETSQHAVNVGTGRNSGDAGSLAVSSAATESPRAEKVMTAKDKVLIRMQQFKRASPPRMAHRGKRQPANNEDDSGPDLQPQGQDHPEPYSSHHPSESDEALALRLQQELDREAAETEAVDLEDGGLFFCQICQRDLSHMTPDGRMQHINRCLDESEERVQAPLPPPAPPGVPDCPICGKRFKSLKNRSAHLKRCSSDMGVSPAVLLQAVQRQAEETQNVLAANMITQTGGTKRKGPTKSALPVGKKPRKKTDPLDEDTMVALALSSSLLEQEKGAERELQTKITASHISMTPALKKKPDAGKGRGKKKKGAITRPPPLLLIQDAQAALVRLEERVSALLLRSRAPSPPTPTLSPSRLRGWNGAAPLWQKSALLDSYCASDFYTPELSEFITPWESAKTVAPSSDVCNKLESSRQLVNEETPVMGTRASIVSSSSQNAASSPAASTPGTGRLPVGSQALCDLMELAEDGMTLTQCGYAASDGNKNRQSSASLSTNLHVSGFVLEEAEQQDDLCSSGFLPETVQTPSEDVNRQSSRKSQQLREDKGGSSHRSAALSRLSSDLSSMVNNPQLSDVQLQVDSGDVYFAHSFMVYARCPLLAEMVHESGFGVREEGMSAAQRVLLSDVPGQAVLTLLQYLYTAHCSIPASLQPHVLELASRFDLKELQQLCHLHPEEAAALGEEADDMNQDANVSDRTDLAFMELLRSMWNEEDEDVDTDEGQKDDGGFEERHQVDDVTSSEREICEEQVNEQELEEIYQFAATQRKKEEEEEDEEKDSMEEEEEEKVDDGEEVFTKLTEPKRGSGEKTTKPDPKLDLSYSRLFSDSWGVYEEKDLSSSPSTSSSPKIHTPQSQKYQTPRKPQHTLSGRTLLQSSPSIVDGISPSASPITSNLPIAGLSPGQDSDWGGGGGGDKVKTNMVKKCLPLKRESHGPRSICAPVSPDLFSKKKKEPELIVLSDSSEEMEADVAVLSPSPLSPCNVQNQKSCTQIKPQTILKPTEPVMDNKVSSSLELNTSDPAAASARSCPGSSRDQIPVDCSLEVSWLIPSTPVQPGPNTRTNSTQTKTSMCRTRLFPKGDTSSASSLLSSPALPLNSKHQTPSCVSVHSGPTEGSVSRLKLDEAPCSSSFNVKFSPDTSNNSMLSAGFPHQPKVSNLSSAMHRHPLQTSFTNDTPLHIQHQPHSSTPLHTDHYQPPDPLTTSPLHSSLSKQKSTSQKRNSAPSENPEKRQLMSFHLSPLSDPSDPPTSPCHRSLKSSQRHRKSSSESPCSVASSSRKNTGSELKSMIRNKEDEREIECENNDMGDEVVQEKAEENGEAEVADSSFQHSFMDEPPIAFNDSWGFDANPGCFSLRLEDSRGSNQQERGETARSSPPSDCRPPPSTHWVQSPKSCERVINSSSSEAHSTSPSTSRQAQIRASLTPSPPEQNSLLDSKIWDSWREEDEEVLPLSQRVNPSAHLKTPASSRLKKRCSLVPITPMPHYSDMDTPELKNKLNRFGVRPLPKRQMILKLKEIHQYTHQLVSSDSEDEATSARQTARTRPPAPASSSASSRPVSSSTQRVTFKEPSVPTAASPLKQKGEEEGELLSASQGSNTSSTAASEESERSNPELCVSSDDDSDSDGGISASQAATRLQDRLQAVRSFILTDSRLYSQILQYQPLVLSQLQQRLKTAGIRLGAAKLVDYLDSQCITFTTAKPGHSARSRRQGKKTGKVAKTVGERGAKRKKVVTAML